MIHRINIFLLSLFIAFAPTYIFAGSVASEGWSVTKRLVQGATTFYDGTKNVVLNGKEYVIKGSAFIIPNSAQVGKMIARTGAVLAVDLAIKSLINGVDYVMDPANNRVKYFEGNTVYQYAYQNNEANVIVYTESQALSAAQAFFNRVDPNKRTVGSCSFNSSKTSIDCVWWYNDNSSDRRTFLFSRVANPAYDPNAREEKYLSFETVGSQLISDANSDNANAKAYVSSVADTALEQDEERQLVPATDIVNQLNYNQSIPTSNTAQGQAVPQANPDDPTAPKAPPTDITINFPVFCDWAPSVCQAANAAINFPNLFVEKFQKWDDWLNRETKPYTADETKINTEDKRTFDFSVFNANRFSVDDKCPTPEPQTISVLGVTTSFSLSLQPVCSILELAKPALVACSYIYAAYIVIGAAKGG